MFNQIIQQQNDKQKFNIDQKNHQQFQRKQSIPNKSEKQIDHTCIQLIEIQNKRKQDYIKIALELCQYRSIHMKQQDPQAYMKLNHNDQNNKKQKFEEQATQNQIIKRSKINKLNTYIELKQLNENNDNIRIHILDEHLCVLQQQIYQSNNKKILFFQCNNINQQQKEVVALGRTKLNSNYIYFDCKEISRQHSEIYRIKNSLYPRLAPNFLAFLCCRQSIQDYHPLYKLSKTIVRKIFSYARNNHGYYILDKGSRNGTFIKIINPLKMKLGDVYYLAWQKYILNVKQRFQPSRSNLSKQLHNIQFMDTAEIIIKSMPNVIVIGNFNIQIDCFGQSQDNDNLSERYYWILLEIQCEQSISHYLISSSLKSIGLGLNSDINLDDPSVPYDDLQAQIKFQNQQWWLVDGGNFPSIYGTWKKLLFRNPQKLQKKAIIRFAETTFLEYELKQRNESSKQQN